MNELEEILQIFFAETEDLLKRSEESLLSLEAAPGPGPDLEELFRAIHTLKSSCAMVGFNAISKYVHIIENLLDRIRNNQLSVTKPLISFLLEDVDFVRAMVDRCAAGDDTLMEIICHPGFSTASSVTELSGRGVGMDVVKTQVERVGGSIQIKTKKGKGTVFTLIIPLTFTLTEALHVRDQDRSYLVPLWGIMGVGRFDAGRMRSFGADEKVYRFREEYLPLMSLCRVYGTIAPENDSKGMAMVFLDTGKQKFGILIDGVLASCQVVVKSIELHYRSVRGVGGATIMGDGSAAIVLDLLGLEEIFFKQLS